MVKKGALSGAIVTVIGGGLLIYTISVIVGYDQLTVNDFAMYSSFQHFGLPTLAWLIYLVGLTIFFFAHIGTKKLSLIIGGIILWIGMAGMIAMYFSGKGDRASSFTIMVYTPIYQIFAIVALVGAIAYYVGLIRHRKNFKLGILSGLLIVLVLIAVFVFEVIIIPGQVLTSPRLYNLSAQQEDNINIDLVIQAALVGVLILHEFLFSFCKIGERVEEEEELSVEKGDAFASYVDESEAYRPSKKKQKPADDDVIFEF